MKNNVLIVALVALIIGLFVGYNLSPRGIVSTEEILETHNVMENEMHDDDMIRSDGAMQHAMDEMMVGFRGKAGEDFEKAFLEMMIVHHIGAIEMAEELLEQTDRPELVKMGNDIISVQTEEVDMMKKWLNEWFNA